MSTNDILLELLKTADSIKIYETMEGTYTVEYFNYNGMSVTACDRPTLLDALKYIHADVKRNAELYRRLYE